MNYIQRQQMQRLYDIGRHREAAAQTALMLCCIALNRKYGFGKERLKKLSEEVNAQIAEFYKDPEAGCYNIKRAVEQIGFDDELGDIMQTLAVHDSLMDRLKKAGR